MENQTTTKFKRWEDLDITDDFIFTRVMRNKKLCRTLLEMILKDNFHPGFLGAGAVSQRLNRDSLKSLNILRFSG